MHLTIDPGNPDEGLRREWLLTDGLGGYAMGTVLGVNTRRYHGLLVAALHPPVGRVVALHSVIEQLVIDGEVFDLSTQQFGEAGALHPEGWRHLTEFSQTQRRPQRESPGECIWRYRIGALQIERRVSLDWGSVQVGYLLSGLEAPVILRVRPFTPLRDFHAVHIEADGPCEVLSEGEGNVAIARGEVILQLQSSGAWRREPQWWRRFAYGEDRARGQEWREDVWSAGVFEVEIKAGEGRRWWVLSAQVNSPSGGVRRSAPLVVDRPGSRLRWAAEQYVVERVSATTWHTTVIAGYPWFGDWGRDTMIALPGLLLCTGKYEEAKSALLMFAGHLRRGLLPNVFDDYGSGAAYNTVDASLWFIHAVCEYAGASGDAETDELFDACRAILFAYRNGTDFEIRLDDDGLIAAGDEESQLTWMDAKRDGVVFTPRHGKAVEINALWHHALLSFAELTTDEREREELKASAARTAGAIREQFWWAEKRCLHDVLHRGDGAWRPEGKLRPNQIFAVSLGHSPLTGDQQRAVVNAVRERLLTPFGLRTLDPDDPGYRGRFEGDLMQRDAAYHNGTVWPWLMGPYCEAVLRVGGFGERAKAEVREVIAPLLGELDRGCVHQIAEVYDGDWPHRAQGCPAQAWSVAELLRVVSMVEGEQGQAGFEG